MHAEIATPAIPTTMDREIVAVLSLIKNTWPAEQRSWQEQVNGTPQNKFIMEPKENSSSLLDKLVK